MSARVILPCTILATVATVAVWFWGDGILNRAGSPQPSAASAPLPTSQDPESISLAPPITAEEAQGDAPKVENANSEAAAAFAQPAPMTAQSASAAPLQTTFRQQSTPERFGLTATLEGFAEDDRKFIATVRFSNSMAADLGVALRRDAGFRAVGLMTDTAGGNCQMVSNGDSFGSMKVYGQGVSRESTLARFAIVPGSGSTRQTLFFNKPRCDTPISMRNGIEVSGVFMVLLPNDDVAVFPYTFVDILVSPRPSAFSR